MNSFSDEKDMSFSSFLSSRRSSGQFYSNYSDLICQVLMETVGIIVEKYPANPYASLRQQQEDESFGCSPMKMSGSFRH